MCIWEVSNNLTIMNGKTSSKTASTRVIASEYSKILAEKISNVKTDVRQMEAVQNQLDEIRDLQEELTGKVKFEEDSGNANRKGHTVSRNVEIETVKHFMPDGSIMVTTYENGKITGRVLHKPHMMVVPDYTAPPKPDGSPDTELKPSQSLEWEMLLMM